VWTEKNSVLAPILALIKTNLRIDSLLIHSTAPRGAPLFVGLNLSMSTDDLIGPFALVLSNLLAMLGVKSAVNIYSCSSDLVLLDAALGCRVTQADFEAAMSLFVARVAEKIGVACTFRRDEIETAVTHGCTHNQERYLHANHIHHK
jgi:hypothetical protein